MNCLESRSGNEVMVLCLYLFVFQHFSESGFVVGCSVGIRTSYSVLVHGSIKGWKKKGMRDVG